MKNRVKNLELVAGKAKASHAAGGAASFKAKQEPSITLHRQDSLKLEGVKACKGKNPIGAFAGDGERQAAVQATIKQHSIEPVGVFLNGDLWHVIEFQDEDAGHSCEFSGVEGVITFGPVPKPPAQEVPE